MMSSRSCASVEEEEVAGQRIHQSFERFFADPTVGVSEVLGRCAEPMVERASEKERLVKILQNSFIVAVSVSKIEEEVWTGL